jgi:hypothetical protein
LLGSSLDTDALRDINMRLNNKILPCKILQPHMSVSIFEHDRTFTNAASCGCMNRWDLSEDLMPSITLASFQSFLKQLSSRAFSNAAWVLALSQTWLLLLRFWNDNWRSYSPKPCQTSCGLRCWAYKIAYPIWRRLPDSLDPTWAYSSDIFASM